MLLCRALVVVTPWFLITQLENFYVRPVPTWKWYRMIVGLTWLSVAAVARYFTILIPRFATASMVEMWLAPTWICGRSWIVFGDWRQDGSGIGMIAILFLYLVCVCI